MFSAQAGEAGKLADLIKAKHLPLTTIFISHGHTDHFTGMALFHAKFPQARIVVASEAIKRDIKGLCDLHGSGRRDGSRTRPGPGATTPIGAESGRI